MQFALVAVVVQTPFWVSIKKTKSLTYPSCDTAFIVSSAQNASLSSSHHPINHRAISLPGSEVRELDLEIRKVDRTGHDQGFGLTVSRTYDLGHSMVFVISCMQMARFKLFTITPLTTRLNHSTSRSVLGPSFIFVITKVLPRCLNRAFTSLYVHPAPPGSDLQLTHHVIAILPVSEHFLR